MMIEKMSASFDDVAALFVLAGLSEQKTKETLKNKTITKNFELTIRQALLYVNEDQLANIGILLYHVATKLKAQIENRLDFLVQNICNDKLKTEQQLTAALDYLLSNLKADVKDRDFLSNFETACGVGVEVTPEQIEDAVEKAIGQFKAGIVEQRYRFNMGFLIAEVKKFIPWADGKAVKSEVDIQILDLLGTRTDADLNAPKQKAVKQSQKDVKPQVKKSSDSAAQDGADSGAMTISELMKEKVHFHKPGENFKADGYVVTEKTHDLIKQHLEVTGGQVRTRFPPEPNGVLHIGHAKAININFGYAKAHGGVCFLRYDDTNPEKEEEEFFIAIKDVVEWLGYKPYKVTHSSDNFSQLYEWAKELIKRGQAYVCHQRPEELKGFNPPPSPWRDRPIEESLQLFEDMKRGKLDEGSATLRMKLTLEEGKQDPVAYRIKFCHHARTGDTWCIYPTYDYTHCLCDSIEQITHSLCTKEFQSRRSSYYWLCNALDVYCPVQWEYGRLNLHYAVVSKRKILKLITEGVVHGWDDPRLFTLTALRRKGYPAEAVNNFCARMGVTMAQSTVDPVYLEACVRDYLNNSAPRVMVVLEPLKITITNYPHHQAISIEVPNFPQEPDRGNHTVTLDKVVYVESDDFRESADKSYRRLTQTQGVGLRHVGLVISVTKVIKDSSGKVLALEAVCQSVSDPNTPKPQAFVHWVANPVPVSVRLYEKLFLHKNPEDPDEVPGGIMSDINPKSLTVVSGAVADRGLLCSKHYDKFQFERIGFFSVDPDTTAEHLVFNRTVSLKEDSSKNA